MFEEDSRPVNSLASLSPFASSDLRKDPEGLWKQALFMLRGMLRRSGITRRPQSNIFEIS